MTLRLLETKWRTIYKLDAQMNLRIGKNIVTNQVLRFIFSSIVLPCKGQVSLIDCRTVL